MTAEFVIHSRPVGSGAPSCIHHIGEVLAHTREGYGPLLLGGPDRVSHPWLQTSVAGRKERGMDAICARIHSARDVTCPSNQAQNSTEQSRFIRPTPTVLFALRQFFTVTIPQTSTSSQNGRASNSSSSTCGTHLSLTVQHQAPSLCGARVRLSGGWLS